MDTVNTANTVGRFDTPRVRDIAVVLITMDRIPRGKENYLPATLSNFKRAGVFNSPRLHSFHICDSGSPSGWLASQVESAGLSGFISLHLDGNRLACENAGYALMTGAKTDATWTLFCEDDLDLCADFLDSVGYWLDDHGSTPQSDKYRVFTFGTPYDQIRWCHERGRTSWEYNVCDFYGTQCFAIRRDDALSLGTYLLFNPRVRGIFNPNAYDLMFHDWMAGAHPDCLFLASAPSFVQHIGAQSVCTGKETTHTFDSWPGREWSYKSTPPSDPHITFADRKPSVLWIGDAVVSTGFARCTHAVCDGLHAAGWTVNVIGMGYYGDPHSYPYTIWPAIAPIDGCKSYGGEMRLPLLIDKLRPDVVVLLNDPWNVDGYFKYLSRVRDECVIAGSLMPEIPPIVGWIAVDACNQKAAPLNQLAHVVTWTQFGADELVKGGYKGPTSVVPLGVNRTVFYPRDKAESRRRCLPRTWPADAYVVGFVGRNQPRKRLDLIVQYFAEWVHRHSIDNAYLYLHVAPTGELACDLKSLVTYYGVNNHVAIATPHVGAGDPESAMPHVYSAFDVYFTTTTGEGWQLPALEAMSCGVVCVLPDNSAFGQGGWVGDAALKVPCISTALNAPLNGGPYTIGGVVDMEGAISTLDNVYRYLKGVQREGFIERGLRLAQSLTWDRTASEFQRVLENVLGMTITPDVCEESVRVA